MHHEYHVARWHECNKFSTATPQDWLDLWIAYSMGGPL